MQGNNTILRYLISKQFVNVFHICIKKLLSNDLNVNNYFTKFDDITISSIKSYLYILNCIDKIHLIF